VLGPEEEIDPEARALDHKRDTNQLKAWVNRFLRNLLQESGVVDGCRIDFLVGLVVKANPPHSLTVIRLSWLNMNELHFLRQVRVTSQSFGSKTCSLATLESQLGTNGLLKWAGFEIEVQLGEGLLGPKRLEQFKVFDSAWKAVCLSRRLANGLQ
jgi:hypothetical protein